VFTNNEHLKKVNIMESAKELVEQAVSALERLTGKTIRVEYAWETERSARFSYGDGVLVFDEHQEIGFDIAPSLGSRAIMSSSNYNRLREPYDRYGNPFIFITKHVSSSGAEKMQGAGIGYLDASGNAFIRSKDSQLFILISGQRPYGMFSPGSLRAFRSAGLLLLYQLLAEPSILQAPYRLLAEHAKLSLGSVSVILKDLQQTGLLRDEDGQRRWTDVSQVLRRWVEGYGEVLRPKLRAQRYRWLDPTIGYNGWQNIPLDEDSYWGGEPAAYLLLDGYLLPEVFTLYTSLPRGELMRRFRLVPDSSGTVEALPPPTNSKFPYRPEAKAAHPLLAYADLLLTADPRNREVAHLLHERYLSYLN
jgi:hypothetical protein